MRSETSGLMVANVHFEPNSSFQERHLRLHALCAHWPVYLAGLGVSFVDFNISEPGSRQGSCNQDVSTKRIVDHSRASCLFRTRRCPNTNLYTKLHVFQIMRTFHVSVHNLTVITQYHRIHEHEDCLVVWPTQSPLAGYEPNAFIKISSTEVLLLFTMHQGSPCFCSAYNSGEDATSAPVS